MATHHPVPADDANDGRPLAGNPTQLPVEPEFGQEIPPVEPGDPEAEPAPR